jgi:carboxymethylenebutenolidase
MMHILQSPRSRALLALVVLASIGALLAAPLPTSQTVQFQSGDETVSAYLALPASGGRHPAIIVIHEFWGLNDWIKQNSQKFADQGYVALAVDLYRGGVATTPGDAQELMRALPKDRAVRDLEAAFTYLASRPDVDPTRIGAIGWCMGGGYSFQVAIHEPALAACVVNYGAPPTDPADIAAIHAPILGNFGADDMGITAAAVHTFAEAANAAHKSFDVKEYVGAGHAFENPNNTASYRPEAAADAWNRITAFFAAQLKP